LQNLPEAAIFAARNIVKWPNQGHAGSYRTGKLNMNQIELKIDPSKSIRSIVYDLIEGAFARQRECPSVMIADAVFSLSIRNPQI